MQILGSISSITNKKKTNESWLKKKKKERKKKKVFRAGEKAQWLRSLVALVTSAPGNLILSSVFKHMHTLLIHICTYTRTHTHI